MNLIQKDKCDGCLACVNICPRNAISCKADGEGFLYPEIDHKLCSDCGLCNKVCPRMSNMHGEMVDKTYEQKYYAARHSNNDVVNNSSSGGVFTAFSDYILEQDGLVYGVCFDDNFKVCHMRAEEKATSNKFCGSKYVQSDCLTIYKEIEADLKNEKKVLFVGTPCQVSGIKNYCKVKNINLNELYTIDFICHGVASPLIWKEYVTYLENKYQKKITKYVFRGKEEGWHNWYPLIGMGESQDCELVSKKHQKKESFILMYQSLTFNRKNCFSCIYTSYDRCSDLTLGDFWNIKSIAPEMDNNRGTSEVLVNSVKGQRLFEACKNYIESLECSKKDVWQPHLEYPNAMPKGREKFWDLYSKQGFEKVVKVYGKGDFMTRLKNTATPILKKTGLYVLFGKLYQKVFVK